MTRAILTDIEGTTSSIAFVKEVLFPYARSRIAAYVHSHARDPEVASALAEVSQLVGGAPSLDELGAALERFIDEDRKLTPLKWLQGKIWEGGYRDGSLQSHVYPDAERQLRAWHAAGHALYVYSSGSVAAQKLLFAHTPFGDLTPLFSGYFDTRIGAKQASDSYRAIVRELGLAPSSVLFLSDVVTELDAAVQAGLGTCWIARPEEPTVAQRGRHPIACDFAEVLV
jgi:enolase-phosphatase E1